MRYEMNSNVLRAKPRANSHILKLAEDDDAVFVRFFPSQVLHISFHSLSPHATSLTSTDLSTTISVLNEWQAGNWQSVLWLPDHRAIRVAVLALLFVFGNASGRVSFGQFAQGSDDTL